jgi:hypothetical protein
MTNELPNETNELPTSFIPNRGENSEDESDYEEERETTRNEDDDTGGDEEGLEDDASDDECTSDDEEENKDDDTDGDGDGEAMEKDEVPKESIIQAGDDRQNMEKETDDQKHIVVHIGKDLDLASMSFETMSQRYTVNELRKFCNERGLEYFKRKADCINALLKSNADS